MLLEILADIQPLPADWKWLVDLLLGPTGLTAAALVIIVGAWREWWVPGSRYRRDTQRLQDRLDKALETGGEVAKSIADRNAIEQARLDILRGSRGLSDSLAEAEHQLVSQHPRSPTRNARTRSGAG